VIFRNNIISISLSGVVSKYELVIRVSKLICGDKAEAEQLEEEVENYKTITKTWYMWEFPVPRASSS